MSAESLPPAALAGRRVVELAGLWTAATGKLLADMGADVIKLEPPGGDPLRARGPFLADRPDPEHSLSFWHDNSSKRGVTLSLVTAEGRALFARLAATADLVIESEPPGSLDALGCGPSQLRAAHPSLSWLAITPFGQDGPRAHWRSSDLVAQAAGGLAYVCGDPAPGPLQAPGGQAARVAAAFGAIAVLGAWVGQTLTGQGRTIDLSLQECVLAVLEQVNWMYFQENRAAQREGVHWGRLSFLVPCRDEQMLFDLSIDWTTLVEWLDSEGLADALKDERFYRRENRRREVAALRELISRWTRRHAAAELVEEGQLRRFAWSRVAPVKDLPANPQLAARGFWQPLRHADPDRTYTYPGAPYRLEATPWRIGRRPPRLGEHNAEILGELGVTPTELERLRGAGAI